MSATEGGLGFESLTAHHSSLHYAGTGIGSKTNSDFVAS
jgi:hypothetical protein